MIMEEEEDIDSWKNGTINAINEIDELILSCIETTSDDEYLDQYWAIREIWINVKMTLAMEQKAMENLQKEDLPITEMIPEKYHDFLDIFDEEKASRFPESRSWDHKIELKEGFVPKSFKNYNLTPVEQIEQDKFLKENLAKGYIRPSQSPMASPLFFVGKNDGKL